MDMARVIGTVVATEKDPLLHGLKLCIVQPLNDALEDDGKAVVAVDALNRNVGEIVYIVRSGDAMMAHHGNDLIPVDCAIGGMVDFHTVQGKKVRNP